MDKRKPQRRPRGRVVVASACRSRRPVSNEDGRGCRRRGRISRRPRWRGARGLFAYDRRRRGFAAAGRATVMVGGSADADGPREEAVAVPRAWGGPGSRRLTAGGDSAATGPSRGSPPGAHAAGGRRWRGGRGRRRGKDRGTTPLPLARPQWQCFISNNNYYL